MNPTYPNIYFNYATILEKLGKFDLALSSYNKVLELNPDDLEAKEKKQEILDMQKSNSK
ncbi:hypothetical protein RAS_11520 [Rickettsia asiatica]|uniref:Uncharacterized protein n=1 Tax=Rickettsia asiatica TaxID=238800 RepID=A0A510G880_9RICK|nr:hypothetical protein RAS_11520 [Rickettsia asiatica]